jgi:hypothetical protein
MGRVWNDHPYWRWAYMGQIYSNFAPDQDETPREGVQIGLPDWPPARMLVGTSCFRTMVQERWGDKPHAPSALYITPEHPRAKQDLECIAFSK